MSNAYGNCTTDPTVDIPEGYTAVRISFPYEVNSVNPVGDPQKLPYNVKDLILGQISSFIPTRLRDNIIRSQCDIIVVLHADALYLVKTYPQFFSYYTNP